MDTKNNEVKRKRVLLTGATGYIGKRLLPVLLQMGYEVVCCVRDKKRFSSVFLQNEAVSVIEVDFLKQETLSQIPEDIDAAYYLIHSMATSKEYQSMELESAVNFREAINATKAVQVIYLGGILNEKQLSKHLSSRKAVEETLAKGRYFFTGLRAGIIIGSGSASFEIIRDLVEKLPIMVAPEWLKTKCQPIAVRDVIHFLSLSIFEESVYNKVYDIGSPDVLSYRQMLLGYAKARGLKRWIFTLPVMTPKLSSYWLYFITSTSYSLASALVESMKVEVVCKGESLNWLLPEAPLSYIESLQRTLQRVDESQVPSSWIDSWSSSRMDYKVSAHITVPEFGCLIDRRMREVFDYETVINRIWKLGGAYGWYYANWLWNLRGWFDKLFGGVGLRRGRRDPEQIQAGDALDFWRVLYANKEEGRLMLYAEMKLPGEAWLEFKLDDGVLYQTASFRPKGVLGRLYWYGVYPLHLFVFKGLINKLAAR